MMPGLVIILVPVALVLIYAVDVKPSGYAVPASRDDDLPGGSRGGFGGML